MLRRLITQIIPTVACLMMQASAFAKEADYTLTCHKEEYGRGSALTTKMMRPPVIAHVKFTGTESRYPEVHPEARGQVTTYDDLTIQILGQTIRGGAVRGSTYESSMLYDSDFLRTRNSRTDWAYSREIDAWNLKYEGRRFICKQKLDRAPARSETPKQEPFAGWWIVLASYPDNPPERMSDDVRAVERQARSCSIKIFNDFSAKFVGFAPGYVAFVQAAPPFKTKNVADVELHRVRGCFPGAYVKRARYLGE